MLVDVSIEAPTSRLCLLAHGDGEVVFAQGYGGAGEPAVQDGTLAFVAGDRVGGELHVTAWASAGGRPTARATVVTDFARPGSLTVRLPVRRCQPDSRGGTLTPRILATTSAPSVGADAAAIDLDGDGRAELVLAESDGTVSAVTPAGLALGARLFDGPTRLVGGDADGDCRIDLLGLSTADTSVVPVGGTGLPRRAGPSATGATMADTGRGASTLFAGPSGLMVVGLGGEMTLDASPMVDVVAADLNGDGLDELVTSSPSGARAFLGSGAGPTPLVGALPPSFAAVGGPLALGDIDGDGSIDLVGAAGTEVRLGRNRGDGLLEDRTGTAPDLGGVVRRLRLGDLDGDCADELLVVDEDGRVAVYRMDSTGLVALPLSLPAVRTADLGDIDGDGALELLLWTTTGEVQAWDR